MMREFRRADEVRRWRRKLEREGFPRLQMFLIVCVTGFVGFFASYSLLHHGVSNMGVRYPLSVGMAYLGFLCMLWLWLRTSVGDYWGEIPSFPGGGSNCVSVEGGASAVASSGPEGAEGVGDALSAAAGADELAIPLIVLVLFGIGLLSMAWLVYAAPVLLAEILLDGVLVAGLYRKLKQPDPRHWLETAFRLTWKPFLITAIFLGVAGLAMQLHAPDAVSVGGFLSQVQAE